jgi:uncharacterized protein YggU (UPF0235/DUF167 family)
MTKLRIKVLPGASRNGIAGWLGETLKVRVTAAPERGRANAAVAAIVADALGLPQGCARIVSGKTSPRKILEVSGLTESEIRERLAKRIP